METLVLPAPLRAKLGEPASEGLVEMFTMCDQFATARLDRKLDQMRVEWRAELHEGLAGIRIEMAGMRADMFKWMLMFWIGQFAALVGALSFMLPPR